MWKSGLNFNQNCPSEMNRFPSSSGSNEISRSEHKPFLNYIESKDSMMTSTLIYLLFSFYGIVCITHDLGSLSSLLLIAIVMSFVAGFILLRYKFVSASMMTYIEACHFLLTCLSNGYWMFCRSYNNDLNPMRFMSCNINNTTHNLSVETIFYVMLTPIVYSIVFKHTPWQVILPSWFICIISISLFLINFSAYKTIIFLIFYAPISFLLIFKIENERYLSDLSAMENIKYETRVNKIIQDSEAHELEIKNMLSNVTHDMKTVRFIHLFIQLIYYQYIVFYILLSFLHIQKYIYFVIYLYFLFFFISLTHTHFSPLLCTYSHFLV